MKRRVAHVSFVDDGVLLGLESSPVDGEITWKPDRGIYEGQLEMKRAKGVGVLEGSEVLTQRDDSDFALAPLLVECDILRCRLASEFLVVPIVSAQSLGHSGLEESGVEREEREATEAKTKVSSSSRYRSSLPSRLQKTVDSSIRRPRSKLKLLCNKKPEFRLKSEE